MGADHPVRLFVYGTLMPGCPNHWQMEDHVHKARPGRIKGILMDLGTFPALVAGEGLVEGVVLDVNQETLAITDRIEGCRPDWQSSLYLRRETTVQLESGENLTAWTYEWAKRDSIQDRPKLIVGEEDGIPVHAWRTKE